MRQWITIWSKNFMNPLNFQITKVHWVHFGARQTSFKGLAHMDRVSWRPFSLVTRSTQRAQTSLAEADHYSHIAHCKNVEPWLWKTTHPPKKKKKKKKKKKVLDHYLHHDLGMLPLLRCIFAHLLILQYPDHHQNLISSSLYYSGPVHKISSQSVHNFLSNVVHRQTNKQTN